MVYAPFRRYNPEARTWVSKQEHDKEFREFRTSDEMKKCSYERVLREWRLKPEHMGQKGYRKYFDFNNAEQAKLSLERIRQLRKRARTRFPKRPR